MPIGLKGNSDGSGAIQIGGSDAISISTGLNTTFAGTITASGGVMYPLTSGTAIASTSGTSLDFTGIPSWVKRITVMFNGVSTNGTSIPMVQLGSSGGIEITGYTGSVVTIISSAVTSAALLSSGVLFQSSAYAANLVANGAITFSLVNASTNSWVFVGSIGQTTTAQLGSVAGSKALSGTLDRVRITTVNGTDAFDAGTINILYE